MIEKRKGWASAMKEFFGFRPGKGAQDFMAELKALSPEEKLTFAHMLRTQAGIDCDDPMGPATAGG